MAAVEQFAIGIANATAARPAVVLIARCHRVRVVPVTEAGGFALLGCDTFGSGELTIRHGDEEYEVWFNQ